MARTAAVKTGAADSIVSLKVTLKGTKPPIWRRLLVPGSMTLGGLSDAILIAMGWDGDHLHAFDVDGQHYGDPATTDDVANENRVTLDGVLKSGVRRFGYDYDFGDDWEHIVAVEKTLAPVAGQAYPACVDGKRNCPPEDCGGVWGYAELLEILADPSHPEREERLEWLGDDFDPEEFDVVTADAGLAARLKRK
ncbi:MAG TPA: plasmid pRiA4b ORF-3 family protein [Roseiarcus sp.]|nr:plasmid pRiA4b ORF-3 family protein [Roseiarcus sp.]